MSKDHPGFLAAKWQNGKKFSPRPAVRKGDNTIVFHKFLDCPASVFCCRGRQGHHCCRPHLVPLLQDSSNFSIPTFFDTDNGLIPCPKARWCVLPGKRPVRFFATVRPDQNGFGKCFSFYVAGNFFINKLFCTQPVCPRLLYGRFRIFFSHIRVSLSNCAATKGWVCGPYRVWPPSYR